MYTLFYRMTKFQCCHLNKREGKEYINAIPSTLTFLVTGQPFTLNIYKFTQQTKPNRKDRRHQNTSHQLNKLNSQCTYNIKLKSFQLLFLEHWFSTQFKAGSSGLKITMKSCAPVLIGWIFSFYHYRKIIDSCLYYTACLQARGHRLRDCKKAKVEQQGRVIFL